MSVADEWFFEGRERRRPRANWIPVLMVLVVIVNAVVLNYYVSRANDSVDRLEGELDAILFQLNAANLEIAGLRDSIGLIGQGNATVDLSLTRLYNETRRSVVLIAVENQLGGGQGSGFVFDLEGRIITNNHVVEDATEITVTFLDGTIVDATLVGTDSYSDLAVIDVDVPGILLHPVSVASSSELLVGEQVVALGNPFGLANTMTVGIVSATGRQMDAPGNYAIVDVIQTDAAINPGNSGGPLLNMEGKVVGMNTAILSETRQFSGIGFAIPSDTILREVPSLIEEGKYDHAYMGISGMALIPEVREAMNLDESIKGALVSNVVEGGPADEAGILGGTEALDLDGFSVQVGGDVIIGIEGMPVSDLYELVVDLERNYRPGDVVTLNIYRDHDVIEVDIELGVRPDS